MTVGDAIEMLKKADPKDELKAWDPNSSQWESVTGMTYGGKDKTVQLYTDEP